MTVLDHTPLSMLDLVAVREGLASLLQATDADELMLVCDIFDPSLRLRSLEIVAAARAARRMAGWTQFERKPM